MFQILNNLIWENVKVPIATISEVHFPILGVWQNLDYFMLYLFFSIQLMK